MLRYDRQTKPGLVTLYDIRPGNGAGPRSGSILTTPEPARGLSANQLYPCSQPLSMFFWAYLRASVVAETGDRFSDLLGPTSFFWLPQPPK